MSTGTYLKVWDVDGTVLAADTADEQKLDALFTRWVDSGERIDSVMEFSLVGGGFYKTRVSYVQAWTISAPEYRRRAFELDLAEREELKQLRQEAGIWEDPEEDW